MIPYLHFNLRKLPRSLTREEWRTIYRWKRTTERTIREHLAKQRALLAEAPPELRARIIEGLVNPPLTIYPE